jgi:hypothetical protein
MGWAAETAGATTDVFYKGKTARILVGGSAGGEELQKIVDPLFKLPPAIASKLKEILK